MNIYIVLHSFYTEKFYYSTSLENLVAIKVLNKYRAQSKIIKGKTLLELSCPCINYKEIENDRYTFSCYDNGHFITQDL